MDKHIMIQKLKELDKHNYKIIEMAYSLAMQVNPNDSFSKINVELQKASREWKAKSKELETALEISSGNEEKLRTRVFDLETQLFKCAEQLKQGFKLAKMNKQIIEQVYEKAPKDTAREILQELESALMYYRNSDIACEFVFGIMDEIAKKHGVKPTEDTTADIKND